MGRLPTVTGPAERLPIGRIGARAAVSDLDPMIGDEPLVQRAA